MLEAVEFGKKAFGAEVVTLLMPNGGLMRGNISIASPQVMHGLG